MPKPLKLPPAAALLAILGDDRACLSAWAVDPALWSHGLARLLARRVDDRDECADPAEPPPDDGDTDRSSRTDLRRRADSFFCACRRLASAAIIRDGCDVPDVRIGEAAGFRVPFTTSPLAAAVPTAGVGLVSCTDTAVGGVVSAAPLLLVPWSSWSLSARRVDSSSACNLCTSFDAVPKLSRRTRFFTCSSKVTGGGAFFLPPASSPSSSFPPSPPPPLPPSESWTTVPRRLRATTLGLRSDAVLALPPFTWRRDMRRPGARALSSAAIADFTLV